jgi:hypothetical protein
MKTYVRFWYLAEYLLDWEMFQTKVVEKIQLRCMFNSFFRKSYRLWDKVENCGGARPATDDNIIRCIIITRYKQYYLV